MVPSRGSADEYRLPAFRARLDSAMIKRPSLADNTFMVELP
jgi:hypothetical protein